MTFLPIALLAIAGVPLTPLAAALAAVAMFVVAVVAPRRSKRMQAWLDRLLHRGEAHAGDKAPDAAEKPARKSMSGSRKVIDATARAGRRTRGKLPF